MATKQIKAWGVFDKGGALQSGSSSVFYLWLTTETVEEAENVMSCEGGETIRPVRISWEVEEK